MKTLYGRGMRTIAAIAFTVGAGLILLTAAPANAVGTLAGVEVSNTASVAYDVGGVTQTPVDASDTFLVDRMIDVQVAGTGSTVVPGETETTATLTYVITNQGNDTQSYDLDVSVYADTIGLTLDTTDDVATPSGQYAVYIDVNGDGQLDAGDIFVDPSVLENSFTLAPDASINIIIVAEIPLTATDTQLTTFDLLATTLNADATGVTAVVTTDTTNPDIDSTDTVFVDDATAGNVGGDTAEDGTHSDDATFTVQSANLSVTKSVRVINRTGASCATAVSEPDDADDELFAIPGACIEYTITVSNTGVTIDANNVVITDALPAEITFVDFHADTSGFDTGPSHTINTVNPLVSGDVFAIDTLLPQSTSVKIVIRATIN